MRSYRIHSLTEGGAVDLAGALTEDGMTAEVLQPGTHPLPGWCVVASGEYRSEGLLEMLAEVYGGTYEGEGLAGA